jgi:ubiquinone biosynthesis protein
VPAHQDVNNFAQAIRAIGEPIAGLASDQISMARLLTQLFEVTEQFEMKTQPQLLLLQKTMVVVEGVARTLNSNLNMWKSAEPFVRNWIERTLGPLGKLQEAGDSVRALARLALQIPTLLDEGHKAMQTLATQQQSARDPKPGTLAAMAPWQLAAIVFSSIVLATLVVQLI